MKRNKTPKYQTSDKRNKSDLLKRLKKYPALRLRKKLQLYIIDKKNMQGFNVGGYGSISELHTNLDELEKDKIWLSKYNG